MSRIKYTIVPKDNVEASIFESGVRLTESAIIIDPIIIFNNNMELGIETEIYGDDVDANNIKFTNENNLLRVLKDANDEDFCNTIIINGFNLDLDFVRNHIAKLAKQSEKIFSINVVSDRRKYNNFTINMTSEIDTEFTDEEWEDYKKEYEESFQKSLAMDTEDNKISPRYSEEETAEAVRELLKTIFNVTDDDMDKDEEGTITIDLKDKKPETLALPAPADKDTKPTKRRSSYESYSYANDAGMITIEVEDDSLIMMDEEDEIVVPIDYIDFIIETLKKFK